MRLHDTIGSFFAHVSSDYMPSDSPSSIDRLDNSCAGNEIIALLDLETVIVTWSVYQVPAAVLNQHLIAHSFIQCWKHSDIEWCSIETGCCSSVFGINKRHSN